MKMQYQANFKLKLNKTAEIPLPVFRKLWVLKLECDEPFSNPIAKEWNDFVSTLPVIQNIHVLRLCNRKEAELLSMDLPTPLTAAYVGAFLYAQSISEEDVSKTLVQQILYCTE
ncbi:hypothetical protein TNCV_3019491 [Trichonephila clavipes]|nr:hypothetical protein TNCV_3019491 [Trichonephila clavipes]